MRKKFKSRFKRNVGIRSEYKYVYIFTEGEETEVNYFISKRNEIRKPNIKVKVLGDGYNTLSLVKYAIDTLKKDGIILSDGGDECWVVFDKDNFDKCDFDGAIAKAEANGIKVAYSNEAFELWFLLHFICLTSALNRKQLKEKLSEMMLKKFNVKYLKNSEKMYNFIGDLEENAIKNANHILGIHDKKKLCSEKNPSTTVHLLVESLNSLKR